MQLESMEKAALSNVLFLVFAAKYKCAQKVLRDTFLLEVFKTSRIYFFIHENRFSTLKEIT